MKYYFLFYFFCILSIQAHEIDDEIELFKKTYTMKFKNKENVKNYLVEKCDKETFCVSKSISKSIAFAAKSFKKNLTKNGLLKNKRSNCKQERPG